MRVIYSREMVLFLKNNFKFHNHRILIKCFKIYIFHNSFIKICGYILFFMRKYKKFSIVLEISHKKRSYNKKVDCTGN
jgi:hypothetical protein